jgi:hypothetical protein
LRLADYEARTENLSKPHPFELESVGFAYQNVVHHLFIDHAERSHVSDLYAIDSADPDQPAPMVNMVAIRQLTDDTYDPTESLHNILNESLDESIEGSTKTASSCPTFPLGFRGMIFHISMDSGTKDSEAPEECEARLAKNTDCQRHCNDETAQDTNGQDANDPPRPRHNLQEEFDMVGDQPVHQTPSANLAVTFNELEKLDQSLKAEKI